MNLIFSTNTKEYSPISSGDSYLYDKYNLLFSFLKTKLNAAEINRLAKPVINGTSVDWYANYSGKMSRLSQFAPEWQAVVEESYLKWLKKIQSFATELNQSGDSEKKKWSNLLNVAFNISNNIVVTDGKEWSVIWGWEFRNQLAFATPSFLSDTKKEEPEIQQELPPVQPPISKYKEDIHPKTTPAPAEAEKKDPKPKAPDPVTATPATERQSLWDMIISFFRWIAYRFWGLMMLIVYTLLIILIWEKCNVRNPDCDQNNKLHEKLKYLEGRAKEKCNEINNQTP